MPHSRPSNLAARRLVLVVLLLPFALHAQQYAFEAVFDPLDTRHDMSRPRNARYFITSNHQWACFNRVRLEATRRTIDELEGVRRSEPEG